jgi:hypothetical protein
MSRIPTRLVLGLAEPVHDEALPPGHWHRGVFLARCGEALAAAGRRDEAERDLVEALVVSSVAPPAEERACEVARRLDALRALD